MDQLTNPFVLTSVAALAIAAWLRPALGAAFVLTGATVYYVVLESMGIEPSATVTGATFGVTGIASMSRMLREPTRRRHMKQAPLLLFAAFFLLWQVRWWLSPAATVGTAAAFAERAQLYLLVFGAIPFVLGMTFGLRQDRDDLIRGMAWWGGAGIAILIALLLQQSGGAGWMGGRWRPVAGISTITMSIEIGLGALALLSATEGKRGFTWTVLRTVAGVAPAVIQLRIGQRGPFLFFLVSVITFFIANPRGRAVSRAFQVAAIAVVLAATIAGFVEVGDVRVLQGAGYTAGGNEDRVTLWSSAIAAIADRPFTGWGGELVGQPIGRGWWVYAHNIFLDPFVETGLLGGALVVMLFATIALGARRAWRNGLARDLFPMMPPLAFVMLEAQVSGHISTSKYVWLLAGVVAAASPARSARRAARVVGQGTGREVA